MFTESSLYSSSQILNRIAQNTSLSELWDLTQSSLSSSFMVALTMSEYENKTGINRASSHFGFCFIAPLQYKSYSYMTIIVVADDALDADIAHEIAHLYIHAKLKYPWPWVNLNIYNELPKTTEFSRLAHNATRIYDIAVHSFIDKVLMDFCLFDLSVYERMIRNYKDELNKYLKSFNGFLDDYIFLRTIELHHRLPEKDWHVIESEYSQRKGFRTLMNKIGQLPPYPNVLTPNSVTEFVSQMWQSFKIDPSATGIELLIDTPINQHDCN